MPYGSETIEPGAALALSGGGFRAMLFHIGAVWRLNELGLLQGLKRISSVSGGSIFAGRLAVRWKHLNFDPTTLRALNYAEEVAQPLMAFSTRHVDAPAFLRGLLPLSSAADAAAASYRKHVVGPATLQDLESEAVAPRFVFNASHLGVGTTWRFSQPYMGSYRIGLIREPRTEIATAIAASAAFPPVLSPLVLKDLTPDSFERTEGADLFDDVRLRMRAYLTDGGVYDNLGLETVWSRYETLYVSDAGGGLAPRPGRYWIPGVSQLKRTLDIAVDQGRKLRRSAFAVDLKNTDRGGALWRTRLDPNNYYGEDPVFPVETSWPEHMAAIRTRLNPFSEMEQKRLVNWGYLVSDMAIRTWAHKQAPEPTQLPFAGFGFDGTPP
ncbi:MAG: patatin-like phospholipase family protein [Myxococcota bacterium]